jgi:parallel beta-helix repeat protein
MATYYVRKTGSDSNPGTNGSPKLTVLAGVRLLTQPGDTLIIGDGVYAEAIGAPFDTDFPAHGAPGQPITVRAENKWGAHISVSDYAVFVVRKNYITFDGLRITNPDRHGIEFQDVHHNTVVNCWVHDCGGNGIGGFHGDFYTVENNICHGNGRSGWNSGISVYEPIAWAGDGVTMLRNFFRNNVCFDNHMLGFVNFNSGGTTPIAVGDTVAIGAAGGVVDRVEVTSGSWGAGNAVGRIGILDYTSTSSPANGTAILVSGQDRGTTTSSGYYTDHGGFTDGNGIILDDWAWYQNVGTPYAYGAVIENNLCFRNGGKGIQAYGVVGTCIIRNNTVWHNNRDRWQAFYGFSGSGMTWRGDLSAQDTAALMVNNVAITHGLYNATAIGLYGGTFATTLKNNISFNGTPGQASRRVEGSSSWVDGGGNQFGVNPLLVNPGPTLSGYDFTLQSGSPAINAGTNADGLAATDLAGNARVSGAAVDMGAYEFGSGSPATAVRAALLGGRPVLAGGRLLLGG